MSMPVSFSMALRIVRRGHGGVRSMSWSRKVTFEVADGASRLGDHLFDHRHHVVVVHVGLVGLEHRELGIVLEAHALVAEVLAHLVDAVDAADDAALEVQLGGDAQVEVALELVVVRDERPRQSAAVERLEHGRLDLDEAAPVEELADRADDAGALDEHLAGLVVDHEVEVAPAVAGLDVGEAVELLGHGAQRLAEQLPRRDAQAELAAPGAHDGALGADEVAEVDVLERRVALVAERVELGEQLQLAAGVLEDYEGELAVHAAGHDAAGDAAHVAGVLARLEAGVGVVQRPDLVARLVLSGVDVSGVAPRGELGAPLGEDVAAVLALLVHGGSRQAFSMARTLNFLEPWGTLTVTLSPGL